MIVLVFHVRDQRSLSDNRHAGVFHAPRFSALSLRSPSFSVHQERTAVADPRMALHRERQCERCHTGGE